eukprot:COSAG02_NODE_4562_length_5215_cov_2.705043_6_plen_56_part_00
MYAIAIHVLDPARAPRYIAIDARVTPRRVHLGNATRVRASVSIRAAVIDGAAAGG